MVSRKQVLDARSAYLLKKGFPFVAHGRTQTEQPYAWFEYDNQAGVRLACERLLWLWQGHERIALIGAAGIRLRAPAQGQLHRVMQRLMATSLRPTAVLVDNHLSGVGAVRALFDAVVEIGSEMSIIVWGSVEETLVGSNVTTIDQPGSDKAGAKMIEMLSAVVAGVERSTLQVLWQPMLLAGSTVGRKI